MKILKKYGFSIAMLLALVVGTLLGFFATDEFVNNISPLGDIYINIMFCLVVPLVLFTVVGSIAKMDKKLKLSKILVKTLVVFVVTSLISAIFALVGVLIIKPTANITITESADATTTTSFLGAVANAITVNDFYQLLSRSHILALIIFAIILGLCIRKVDKYNRVSNFFNIMSNAMLRFVKVVMYYAPIGVCAYFATLVKSFGGDVVNSYLKVFLLYIGITVVYFLVFYTLYSLIAGGKKGVGMFYKKIYKSVAVSLATQSSLASLPTNMEVADEIGVDKNISGVSLPIASTIHMEGSSIGSILKIFFLLNIFNMPMNSVSVYLVAILIAVASSVVMSGIPGGGLIGEMLIVSLYGFPAAAFTMIATIGWLIDAPATMLNVCGDIPSIMFVDKWNNHKKYFKTKETIKKR